MAELINLRSARKHRQRAERQAKAEANRLKFGEAKSDRNLRRARSAKQEARLDAHRRGDPQGVDE